MSESKKDPFFAPGPWGAARSDVSEIFPGTRTAWNYKRKDVIADVYDQADAFLIVCAPELYDALQECVDVLESYADISAINPDAPNPAMRAMMQAKDVLAKARGETC